VLLKNIAIAFCVFCAVANAAEDYHYTPGPVGGISGHAFVGTFTYNNMEWNLSGVPASAISQSITGWNIGNFSGASVPSPLSQYQRGYTGAYGGHAVSAHDESDGAVTTPVFSAMMNSWDLPTGLPLAGSYLSYTFSPNTVKPYARGANSSIVFGQQMQIPQVYVQGAGARAYTGQGFTVVDPVTGRYFWFLPKIFDSVANSNFEGVAFDDGTAAYVGTYFGTNRKYLTVSNGSSLSTSQAYSGWRWYGYEVSYAQMSTMLQDLNDWLTQHCDLPASSSVHPKLYSSNVVVSPVPGGITGYNQCTPYPTLPEQMYVGTIYVYGEITLNNPKQQVEGANMGFSTKGHWFYTKY
jgi:hypothetical protein